MTLLTWTPPRPEDLPRPFARAVLRAYDDVMRRQPDARELAVNWTRVGSAWQVLGVEVRG